MQELKVKLLYVEHLKVYSLNVYCLKEDLEVLNKICLLKGITLEVLKE
jgi:hypothetical protein